MRNVMITQEGGSHRKYVLDKNFEVQQKKEKTGAIPKEKTGAVPKKKEPEYVAQAMAMRKCCVFVDRMSPKQMAKIIRDGRRNDNARELQLKVHEMPSK